MTVETMKELRGVIQEFLKSKGDDAVFVAFGADSDGNALSVVYGHAHMLAQVVKHVRENPDIDKAINQIFAEDKGHSLDDLFKN